MNIARLAIKRPILITSIVFILLFVGLIAMSRLGIDMFPDVEFPYVVVQTVYVGSSPEEIENLISKPIEDQVSSICRPEAFVVEEHGQRVPGHR